MLKCDVCGGQANGFECDWPVDKFVRRAAHRLKVSDQVARFAHAIGKKKTQGIAHVTSITPRDAKVIVGITIVWPWKKTVRYVESNPNSEFMVMAKAVCGAKVCDACMIERDANQMVICRNHWRAWEMVA